MLNSKDLLHKSVSTIDNGYPIKWVHCYLINNNAICIARREHIAITLKILIHFWAQSRAGVAALAFEKDSSEK